MGGTLNALGLFLVIGVSIVVLIRFGHLPRSIKPVFVALGYSYALYFLGALLKPFTYEHYPHVQEIIPIGGILLLYPALEEPVRRKMLIFLFVSGLALCLQFIYLTHFADYTSNPSRVNHFVENLQKSDCRQLQSVYYQQALSTPQLGEMMFPAEPLPHSAAWATLSKSAAWHSLDQNTRDSLTEHFTSTMYTTPRLWHTRLTGLYGKREFQTELWYPGGKLREVMPRLRYQ